MPSNASEVPNADLIESLCRSYRCAEEDYVANHKSKHWDVFPKRYDKKLSDPSIWPNFRNNGLTAGFDIGWSVRGSDTDGANRISDPRQVREIIDRYDSLRMIVGPEFITQFHEAEIGNPDYVEHEGLRLNTTDLRHLHDAWRLQQYLRNGAIGKSGRPVIIDIGGGFGGLAAKAKQMHPDALVILFDLPEVKAVQTYYLRTRFPDAQLLTYEMLKQTSPGELVNSHYDFAVLPGWTLDQFPDNSVDLAVNTRSMMEMNKLIVDHYVGEIGRVLRPSGIFYCVNRYIKATVGERVCIKEYAFDDQWYFAQSNVAWDQPWLHELVAIRTVFPNAHPPRALLAALPPHRWKSLASGVGNLLRIFRDLTWGGHHNVNPGLRGRIHLAFRAMERNAVSMIKSLPAVHRLARKLAGRY